MPKSDKKFQHAGVDDPPYSLRGPAYKNYGIGHAYTEAVKAGDPSTVKSLISMEDKIGKEESTNYILPAAERQAARNARKAKARGEYGK